MEQAKQQNWSKSAFGTVAKPPRERSVNAQERPTTTPRKPDASSYVRSVNGAKKPVNPNVTGKQFSQRPATEKQGRTNAYAPKTPVVERPIARPSGGERRGETPVRQDAARTHTAPTRESVQSPKQPNLDYDTFKNELGGASDRGKAPTTGKEMSRETVKETRTVRQEKSTSHESTRTKKTNQTERRTERGKGDAK